MSETSVSQQNFLQKKRQHKRIVHSSRFLILILFLGIEIISRERIADELNKIILSPIPSKGFIDSFIFSSPSKVAACFWSMVCDKSIFLHITVTLYETLVSFFLVILCSLLVTILLWFSPKLSEILEPFLVVLNSLPKSALAPLLIVWLGATRTTIIVAGMSVAIFGSILNLYTTFINADKEKIKLIYTLHGNRFHALMKVVLPSSIPAIISNMKVNIGLCLVGVIIGEFLAARNGLGYLIIYSSQVFKLDWLLMSIVLLCIMAMGLYALINLLEKWYLKKF